MSLEHRVKSLEDLIRPLKGWISGLSSFLSIDNLVVRGKAEVNGGLEAGATIVDGSDVAASGDVLTIDLPTGRYAISLERSGTVIGRMYKNTSGYWTFESLGGASTFDGYDFRDGANSLLLLKSGGIVFNEDGSDIDTRIESANDPNMFRVSSTEDNVYIGGWPIAGAGTSFPGTPVTNETFFRTDLGWLCYYDGSQWLTVEEFQAIEEADNGNTVNSTRNKRPVRTDYAPYFTRVEVGTKVATPNNATNYWTVDIQAFDEAETSSTSIYSFTTSGDTVGTYVRHASDANTTAANDQKVACVIAKNNLPGALDFMYTVFYRLVVT
jgi:hypothetical protein